MSWRLTQDIFIDWMDKGLPVEKVYAGIRLSDVDKRQMNDLGHQDWEMTEGNPEDYTDEQRARTEKSNHDFWDSVVERYGIDTARPFSVDNDGRVHYWRVSS